MTGGLFSLLERSIRQSPISLLGRSSFQKAARTLCSLSDALLVRSIRLWRSQLDPFGLAVVKVTTMVWGQSLKKGKSSLCLGERAEKLYHKALLRLAACCRPQGISVYKKCKPPLLERYSSLQPNTTSSLPTPHPRDAFSHIHNLATHL